MSFMSVFIPMPVTVYDYMAGNSIDAYIFAAEEVR